jgi:hypothetical protein
VSGVVLCVGTAGLSLLDVMRGTSTLGPSSDCRGSVLLLLDLVDAHSHSGSGIATSEVLWQRPGVWSDGGFQYAVVMKYHGSAQPWSSSTSAADAVSSTALSDALLALLQRRSADVTATTMTPAEPRAPLRLFAFLEQLLDSAGSVHFVHNLSRDCSLRDVPRLATAVVEAEKLERVLDSL